METDFKENSNNDETGFSIENDGNETDGDIKSVLLNKPIINPIWLSVSEAAKLGGVQTKTVRRAIQSKVIKYKIVRNRYLIDFKSLIVYLHTKTKIKNKLNQFGVGQYIDKWLD